MRDVFVADFEEDDGAGVEVKRRNEFVFF